MFNISVRVRVWVKIKSNFNFGFRIRVRVKVSVSVKITVMVRVRFSVRFRLGLGSGRPKDFGFICGQQGVLMKFFTGKKIVVERSSFCCVARRAEAVASGDVPSELNFSSERRA